MFGKTVAAELAEGWEARSLIEQAAFEATSDAFNEHHFVFTKSMVLMPFQCQIISFLNVFSFDEFPKVTEAKHNVPHSN